MSPSRPHSIATGWAFDPRHIDGGDHGAGRHRDSHLGGQSDPDTPGAEPHLAGSASCRVKVVELLCIFLLPLWPLVLAVEVVMEAHRVTLSR